MKYLIISRAAVKSLFETGDALTQASFDDAWNSTLFGEDINTLAKLNAYLSDATLVDGSGSDISTFAKLDAVVADVSMLHVGMINTYAELNAIVADATLLHTGSIDTFAKLDLIVADKPLLNATDAFSVFGVWDFQNGVAVSSIQESSIDAGVLIEQILFKDGGFTAPGAVVADGSLTVGTTLSVVGSSNFVGSMSCIGGVSANTISELTFGMGVTVGGTKFSENRIDFSPVVAPPTHEEGTLFYDGDRNTLSLYTDIPDVSLEIGEEVRARVVNKSGATIHNGDVVYVDGAFDGNPTIQLANASVTNTAKKTLGVATHDIAVDAVGYVVTHGLVRGLDLSASTTGDTVFLSTTSGEITSTPPLSPNALVKVGTVVSNSATEGVLFVQVISAQVLRNIYGIMSTQSGATAEPITDSTPRIITAWNTNGVSDGITMDAVLTDSAQVHTAGTYEINVGCSFTGSASETYQVEIFIYDDTTASWLSSGFAFNHEFGNGGEEGSGQVSGIIALDINDKVALYHSSSTGGTSFTVTEAQMVVKRIAE